MTDERVPGAVRSFLRAHIRSLDQLEILLLLQREGEKWWSAEDVADELGASRALAAARLEELASRSLLDVRISERLFFRYAPASPDLDAAARETARAFEAKPVAVITALSSPPVDEIRAFADAFRIRGKEGKGG